MELRFTKRSHGNILHERIMLASQNINYYMKMWVQSIKNSLHVIVQGRVEVSKVKQTITFAFSDLHNYMVRSYW